MSCVHQKGHVVGCFIRVKKHRLVFCAVSCSRFPCIKNMVLAGLDKGTKPMSLRCTPALADDTHVRFVYQHAKYNINPQENCDMITLNTTLI